MHSTVEPTKYHCIIYASTELAKMFLNSLMQELFNSGSLSLALQMGVT